MGELRTLPWIKELLSGITLADTRKIQQNAELPQGDGMPVAQVRTAPVQLGSLTPAHPPFQAQSSGAEGMWPSISLQQAVDHTRESVWELCQVCASFPDMLWKGLTAGPVPTPFLAETIQILARAHFPGASLQLSSALKQ